MFKNFSELKAYCQARQIKMLDFKMIDLSGRWRHLTMPVERFSAKTMECGIGFDGSNYGYAPTEKSDMVFIPDLSTAFEDPFADVATISMIGDIFVIGNPHSKFEQYPRAIAQKAEDYLKQTGIADSALFAPEFEFFVFDQISYEISPQRMSLELDTRQGAWNSGSKDPDKTNFGYNAPVKGGYHIDMPFDTMSNFRSKLCLMLEERGVKIKYHHHEVAGCGQQEIEVEEGSVTEMADKTMLIKYMVKNAAAKAGKTATFMPKPVLGEAGNGLHAHIHLFKDGKPLFYDEKGYSQLSDTALYFMGGILKHAKALSAFVNPSTNSYKRLTPGYEAPVNICFATANRSAVIRIPDYAKKPEDKRFEYRAGDGTANPYFAYSAMLMAGTDGVLNKIDPVREGYGPYDKNLYDLTPEEKKKIKALPGSLDEALRELEKDYEFLTAGGVFPQRLIETWIDAKRKESQAINVTPAPVEFAYYYDL